MCCRLMRVSISIFWSGSEGQRCRVITIEPRNSLHRRGAENAEQEEATKISAALGVLCASAVNDFVFLTILV